MKQTIRLILIPLLILIIPSPGWMARSRPPTEALAMSPDPATMLRADLDKIFSDHQFANALWGAEVYSLDRSEKLYEKESSRILIPASNNKIITAAVALLRLGPDYRFRTHLMADGPVIDGVLKGNLIIVGFGDPSSSSRNQLGDIFQPFRSWAEKLKQQGIQAISGDIIGDGGAFEEIMLGHGWAWDDLSEGYAAPVSALQFNENLIGLEFAPGLKAGDLATIKQAPLANYPTVENKVTTGSEGSSIHIEIERSRSNDNVEAIGTVALKSAAFTRTVPVQYPIYYYLSALKHILNAEGIDVSSCGIRETRGINPQSSSLLYAHNSPPLSEIIKPLLKISLNLGAETLTRTLGMELKGQGAFSKGKEVVEDTLGQMEFDKESYSYADGSGLSRLNLASADMLVRILRSIYQHQYFPFFYSALPIAGVDGTLAARMKGTKAENNVHAKTGSIANVSAISGYLKTRDGEMLAFSIIANNFLIPKAKVDAAQDKALDRLARFSRK